MTQPATATTSATTDRYVSFCGIDCDRRANALIEGLKAQLEALPDGHPWKGYFDKKFAEQARLQVDNLFFVGSQLNNLYACFEALGDEASEQVLWQLEQDCC